MKEPVSRINKGLRTRWNVTEPVGSIPQLCLQASKRTVRVSKFFSRRLILGVYLGYRNPWPMTVCRFESKVNSWGKTIRTKQLGPSELPILIWMRKFEYWPTVVDSSKMKLTRSNSAGVITLGSVSGPDWAIVKPCSSVVCSRNPALAFESTGFLNERTSKFYLKLLS